MNSNGTTQPVGQELSRKIARLVQERGWNQEDFARIAGLNRHTVRTILHSHEREARTLRNSTVDACAKALGLTVIDLRTLPLERLLPRMHGQAGDVGDEVVQHLLAKADTPLREWVERHAQRIRSFTLAEADELLAGPVTDLEGRVVLIERRRELLARVRMIARSEYLGFLEQLVALLYEKVQADGETEAAGDG